MLGVARRPVAWTQDAVAVRRSDVDDAGALLDLLAVGSALGRAGRRPERLAPGEEGETAPEDATPVAPDRAVTLLELHLTQNVAGKAATDGLLEAWFEESAARGLRVPDRLIPAVLERAARSPGLRDAFRGPLGRRGAWLARHSPAWSWFAEAELEGVAWEDASPAARADLLPRLLRSAPTEARRRLATTWGQEDARHRAEQLAILGTALGPEDEELLESALDDHASSVREVAQGLLDGLPESRRAARMADRLRPLLRVHGVLRKRIDVDLPDDPDAAGVRDGLGTIRSGSRRDRWRARIIAGAPLSVWTETGAPIAAAIHDQSDDVLGPIVVAAERQRDVAWARALLERHPLPNLVPVLDGAEAERVVLGWLGRAPEATAMAVALPVPWSARFSVAVARAVRDTSEARTLEVTLAEGLHDDGVEVLRTRLAEAPDSANAASLRRIVQTRSALRSIREAFA